jgi:hypothetical protein
MQTKSCPHLGTFLALGKKMSQGMFKVVDVALLFLISAQGEYVIIMQTFSN